MWKEAGKGHYWEFSAPLFTTLSASAKEDEAEKVVAASCPRLLLAQRLDRETGNYRINDETGERSKGKRNKLGSGINVFSLSIHRAAGDKGHRTQEGHQGEPIGAL